MNNYYRATTSFVLNKEVYADEDVKKGEILTSDFVSEDVIADLLQAGYIEEYDGTLEITENGIYGVEDYENVDVDVTAPPSTLQTKNVTITTNTTTEVEADEGYDGLDKVNVTTNVQPNLESKEVTITENTTTTITPTSGKDGLSSVEVITNVSSGGGAEDYFVSTIRGDSNGNRGIRELVKKLPDTLTVSGTTLQYAFNNCSNLTTISSMDTSSVTNMGYMCANCSNLISVPTLNTQNVTNMANAFRSCVKLENVPIFNLSKATSLGNMFYTCASLTNESLNNILASLLSATSYTDTKTLAQLGLSSAQATTCATLSNWTALSNAGWTTGY